jgi:hypothetical protein
MPGVQSRRLLRRTTAAGPRGWQQTRVAAEGPPLVEAPDLVSAVTLGSTGESSELIPGAAMFPLWRTRPKIPALPRSIKVRRS